MTVVVTIVRRLGETQAAGVVCSSGINQRLDEIAVRTATIIEVSIAFVHVSEVNTPNEIGGGRAGTLEHSDIIEFVVIGNVAYIGVMNTMS